MPAALRILFVEDSAVDYELEEATLRQGGLHFISKRVATKEKLKQALKEFNPDLIISDYTMPDMDGAGSAPDRSGNKPRCAVHFCLGHNR